MNPGHFCVWTNLAHSNLVFPVAEVDKLFPSSLFWTLPNFEFLRRRRPCLGFD
jgi:hypothetical protein